MTSRLAEAMADFERAMKVERKDVLARERMLYARPDYQRLTSLAHDLRNGDPLDMDFLRFKRDYQSAVTWWVLGSLRPIEFLARVRVFENAVDDAWTRRESFEADQTHWEKDYQKYVRRWAKAGFVSRVGWQRLTEQRRRQELWLEARRQRQETAHQRRLLREGQRTLTAIRSALRRGVVPSLPLESTPGRTSPTS